MNANEARVLTDLSYQSQVDDILKQVKSAAEKGLYRIPYVKKDLHELAKEAIMNLGYVISNENPRVIHIEWEHN